ncbi:hypothetical protein ACEPPN_019390 [Leptodophora sp. 'Broadleaf-Isolate-01']
MLLNTLPIMALAGTALAACPISVEVSSAEDHIAQVAVTNTGNETLTVFKGNTVFTDHATRDLLVSDESGNALPFEGIYVNYKRTGLVPEMFQTILPGETITASVNAAKCYRLAGVKTAKVSVIQGFRYVTGAVAPTDLKGAAYCEATSSGTVDMTPDQAKVASEHISNRSPSANSRINKRAVTYSGCSAAQTASLTTSVNNAISMATAAYTAAGTAAFYFTTWFKSTDQETKVRSIYNSVQGVGATAPKIYCNDQWNQCGGGYASLYSSPSDNAIVPCPNNGFWSWDELSPSCVDFDFDRAGAVLHEMTHLFGTGDYGYGPVAAKALSATQASANADSYEMYAGSVRLGGCN